MFSTQQAVYGGEQAPRHNQLGAHETLSVDSVRFGEIALAAHEMQSVLLRYDPYLAATATTGAQVQPSAEVQHAASAAEAAQFEAVAQQVDPSYIASIAAPADIVPTQPQFEQPRM